MLLTKEVCRLWFCDRCLIGFSSAPQKDPFDKRYFDYLLANEPESLVQFQERAAKVRSIISAARALDVGAGTGTFALAMARYGCEVETVDTSNAACDYMREHGVTSHQGRLSSINLPGGYDLVTFWDSLQYVDGAAETLLAARQLLRDGGVLVVQVPHHSGELLKMARLLEHVSERAARSLLHMSSQRYHFTAPGLESLLERTGFTAFDRERGHLGIRLRLRHGIRTVLIDVMESFYAVWARVRGEEAPLVYYCHPS